MKYVNPIKCFSVEITDILIREQLILCVQYVSGAEKNVTIGIYVQTCSAHCARFSNYIEIDSLSRNDIASLILNGKYLLLCYKIVYYLI